MNITVVTTINASIGKVWECWTKPEHITNWNFASDAWHCPKAVNDLRPRGTFNWRMEARDGSMGFDFTGSYEQVVINELITYSMADGRKVKIELYEADKEIRLSETFEAEGDNSAEQQRAGWQAILNNFKNYVESAE